MTQQYKGTYKLSFAEPCTAKQEDALNKDPFASQPLKSVFTYSVTRTSGDESCSGQRKGWYYQIQVIFTTGNGLSDQYQAELETGFNGFAARMIKIGLLITEQSVEFCQILTSVTRRSVHSRDSSPKRN